MKSMLASFMVTKRAQWIQKGLALALVLFFPYQDATAGQAPVDLLSAGSFAVLAGTAITSTSGGTINGDVGVSPGAAFDPGIPAVVVNGIIHLADSAAALAQTDLTTAYNDAAGRTTDVIVLSDQELGSKTKAPGLYKSDWLQITGGNLTLDADGDPNAVWIFQMATTLVVGKGYGVILAGGAQACNVFWQVGSSATLRTTSRLKGNILALTAIWINTDATLDGRALARNAEVTLDANTLTLQPWKNKFPWPMFVPAITGKKI